MLENPSKPLNFRSLISRPWKCLKLVFCPWKSLVYYGTRLKTIIAFKAFKWMKATENNKCSGKQSITLSLLMKCLKTCVSLPALSLNCYSHACRLNYKCTAHVFKLWFSGLGSTCMNAIDKTHGNENNLISSLVWLGTSLMQCLHYNTIHRHSNHLCT